MSLTEQAGNSNKNNDMLDAIRLLSEHRRQGSPALSYKEEVLIATQVYSGKSNFGAAARLVLAKRKLVSPDSTLAEGLNTLNKKLERNKQYREKFPQPENYDSVIAGAVGSVNVVDDVIAYKLPDGSWVTNTQFLIFPEDPDAQELEKRLAQKTQK